MLLPRVYNRLYYTITFLYMPCRIRTCSTGNAGALSVQPQIRHLLGWVRNFSNQTEQFPLLASFSCNLSIKMLKSAYLYSPSCRVRLPQFTVTTPLKILIFIMLKMLTVTVMKLLTFTLLKLLTVTVLKMLKFTVLKMLTFSAENADIRQGLCSR